MLVLFTAIFMTLLVIQLGLIKCIKSDSKDSIVKIQNSGGKLYITISTKILSSTTVFNIDNLFLEHHWVQWNWLDHWKS